MSTEISTIGYQRSGNEDLIKRLFNKMYSAIISEKIFCPPETAVYLAAYACQAKFGSAKGLRDPVPPVKDLLPKSILENHSLSQNDWESRISNWHLKLRHVPLQDAIVEYLDIAQDVELYGASIFEVETSIHLRKWISLDAVGLNVYESKKKPPTMRYVWSDITSFKAWGEKIEIILEHEPHQTIEFFVTHESTGDLLLNLFHGSKELYAKRKQNQITSRYSQRSEANSSMRMRAHQFTDSEFQTIRQQLNELELELPRRATDFEYAPWQVKDQLRQARGIEVKLSLNKPSNEETRKMQRRVADVRVFLEQDFFNADEEQNERPHKYRGNFAIRIGGTSSPRLEGYTSDIDCSIPTEYVSNSGGKVIKNADAKPKLHPVKEQPRDLVFSSSPVSSKEYTSASDPKSSDNFDIQAKPYPSESQSPDFKPNSADPSKMPSIPQTVAQDELTYSYQSSFTHDTTADDGSQYPAEINAKPTTLAFAAPPEDDNSQISSAWQHLHRLPEQSTQSSNFKGRIHGQVIEEDIAVSPYRPSVQPKPKVAPWATKNPITVTPDANAYEDANFEGRRSNVMFSSRNVIPSGFAKKRVDLFEAM